EAVHKELGDGLVRAATTASSLEAEQDNGGGPRCQEAIRDTTDQTRFESVSKHFNDSLLARGVLELEKTKTSQGNEIASLKKRVKKLEKRNKSRTHKLKRLYKVGLTARVESSGDEESLGGEEVFVAEQEAVKDVNENVVEEVVNAAQDSTATTTITTGELTLAQALEALKTLKPKVNGIVIKIKEEPGKSTTTTISKQQSQNKGKGIMIKEPVNPKKKDQTRLDEEASKRLQAKFDKEERLARERELKKNKKPILLLLKHGMIFKQRLMLIINWLKDCKHKNKKSCLMLKKLHYFHNSWSKEESTLQQKKQKKKETNHQHKLKRER
nr:hypothetical protein [Tanacetum cinerariifolium]